jgi:hypothetical protein
VRLSNRHRTEAIAEALVPNRLSLIALGHCERPSRTPHWFLRICFSAFLQRDIGNRAANNQLVLRVANSNDADRNPVARIS